MDHVNSMRRCTLRGLLSSDKATRHRRPFATGRNTRPKSGMFGSWTFPAVSSVIRCPKGETFSRHMTGRSRTWMQQQIVKVLGEQPARVPHPVGGEKAFLPMDSPAHVFNVDPGN